MRFAAGLVQGFDQGTLFTLVADATDPADATLGLAQLEEVSALRGYLRPVAPDCVPRSDALCATVGPLPQARFARLAARPVDQVLRLAPPRDKGTGADLAEADPLAVALAQAALATGAQITQTGAQVQVLADEGRLWFGRQAQVGGLPVGLSWAPQDGVDLTGLLQRMAAAERLAGTLMAAAGEGSLLDPAPVQVSAALALSRLSDLTRRARAAIPCANAAGRCPGRRPWTSI